VLLLTLTTTFAASYDFANHPVAEEDVYTGFIADLDTSNSLAAKFESELSDSLEEGANFAGKYRLTTINCGEQCQVNIIVDVSNGKVVDSMVSAQGVEFAADSRLIQINPGSDFEYHLLWNEDIQRFYRAYAQEVTLNDGRSCFWLGTDTNGTTIHLDGSNNIYGCDALENVAPGTQASILKGTLYHDGGKPLGKFNADYMELKLQGLTAEIAQEKQVSIDIKQIRTQTGSCLKLDPIELEPTLTIYYLCDEGDDKHIVVLSNGFTQIGDALMTEMIRLQRDGENLLVDERLPVYIGLSAAGVDGVSESEKVSEVKPENTDTEMASEEDSESVEENVVNTDNAEGELLSPVATESAEDTETNQPETSDTSTNTDTPTTSETMTEETQVDEVAANSDTAEETEVNAEEAQENTITNETTTTETEQVVENIVEEIDDAVEIANSETTENTANVESDVENEISATESNASEDTTSQNNVSQNTGEDVTETSETDSNDAGSEIDLTEEATNPQTIGTATDGTLAPILMAAPVTQETIDSVTEMVNPTSIGTVEEIAEEITEEVVEGTEAVSEELAQPLGVEESTETAITESGENTESSANTEVTSAEVNTVEETSTPEQETEVETTEEPIVEEVQASETQEGTSEIVETVESSEVLAVTTQSETTQSETTQSESSESSMSEEAETVEESEIEINADNWQSHPDVVSTKMMYSELNEFIGFGLLRQKTQSFENCDVYQEWDRQLWSDKGTPRRYLASYGTESAASTVEHTYDDTGMLRYVYISEGASGGDTENAEAVLEHKIYYNPEGTLLWHDKQYLNQDTSDTEDTKILEAVTFNPQLSFDAEHACD